jgi:hypothetical protein
MTFGKQIWRALAAVVLGALVSSSAMGGVVTRLVTAGGAATSATIAPGGTISIDVRLDARTAQCTVDGLSAPESGFETAPGPMALLDHGAALSAAANDTTSGVRCHRPPRPQPSRSGQQ